MSAIFSNPKAQQDTHHRAEALGGGLPPLLVAAERVASTVSQGVHGRRRVGQGETFWQFRRYEFGDAVQRIDWRRSARADPLYVRETEWEAAQSVWLWRDASPSMEFTAHPDRENKRRRAELLLLALASLLVRGGERTALLDSGMFPSSSRSVMHRLWSMLRSSRMRKASLPAVDLLPRFARLVLIGDFLSSLDEVKAVVDGYAARGVSGHIVQVLDPAEEQLPYGGRVLFEGPEAEGEVLIPHVDSLREAYQLELARHRDGLRSIARRVGWTYVCHHTDHPPEGPLMSLYLQLSQSVAR
jgi:uncharacterized protein (DUF58 family)